jgi:hypothetical protein
MSTIVLTRYLYIKDEVELSLMMSLLTHNDRSLFWAYELYHSGFKNEVFALLWKIYYDFFATLNPSFWEFMVKKEKEKDQVKALASIVNNLLIRPPSLDMFLLRQMLQQKKLPEITLPKEIKEFQEWLKEKDVESISSYVLQTCPLNQLQTILDATLTFFRCSPTKTVSTQKKWAKAIACSSIDPRTHLLSMILSMMATESKIPLGKKLFLIVEDDEVTMYNTIEIDPTKSKARHVLKEATTYPIDENNYLSLFVLNRNSFPGPLTNMYYYHWEYHAAFSPIWAERLARHKGSLIHETRQVVFQEEYSGSDDNQQAFYDLYGYEPDEQSREVQQKNIQYIQPMRTWQSIYERVKNNGIYFCKDLSSWIRISY